jgi:hypothetical protein
MSCKSYLTYEAFMHECMHVRRMGGHAGSSVQPYEWHMYVGKWRIIDILNVCKYISVQNLKGGF